ncbi:hypothetical protein VDP62_21205, partial [Xanthomonas campestris pv. campestris]
LLHVRPLGFTDFIASAGTAQWGQVKCSELQGIKLKKFKNLFGKMRARLVSAIDAEGPICQLPSYAQFKADVNSLYRKRSLKEG